MSRLIGGYISAKETIEAAARNNQSVTDYVETLWQEPGVASGVIANLEKLGSLSALTKRICEIGTGTGMFAESILRKHDISHYESYEPDKNWAEWLSRTYKIISHPTTGDSLNNTPSNSMDLVHANGVFVYTPFLVTCKYLCEIFRVTNRNGYAAFDILSEQCFDGNLLKSWLLSGHTYPCILPVEYVRKFFLANSFDYKGEFFKKFGEGKSHYLVFQTRPT